VQGAIIDSMNVTKLFGLNVRRLRRAAGISQEELARRAGLHRTYIGAVEWAERNITLISAEKIARALGVALKDCLDDQK